MAMFDAILEQKRLARGRMAAGAAISMALHTGALALRQSMIFE